ncbi:DUF2085 domain-containing protein [Clostridium mucosae]|uniref:DUF2085 domain-containing protein n=1 Tax=Clostridium sp. DSM 100503 TaxID=2963282 RepID=UPI0027E4C542|nr:DUF2085 domain-containing protein [Clostridium sp. DSM 100503]
MEKNLNKNLELWKFFMKIGGYTCHQMYERSFSYRGYQFPVCARCTGILIGQIIGIILISLGFRIGFLWSLALILPMVIDGLIQLVKIIESNNIRRLITGFVSGIGYMYLLFNIIAIIKHLVFN